jgi:transposase
MLKAKERNFKTYLVSLDNLLPKDNFYRDVEAKLDLSFVRDLVQDCYSSHMGRPSIDPVVFFKLQLIMFFEGIRSERQLMEMVNLNLAYRWFIGYDLDEKVPDHSALSKIRDRYGLKVFQGFFEQVVEMCIEAGLVWGKELYFDGTKIRANASIDSLEDRWYWQAKEHINRLFPVSEISEQPAVASRFVSKYDGTRMTGRRKITYQRITDTKVSSTDPDASPMQRFTGDCAKLGYHTHYVVDGGKPRIILAALTTPASIMDNTPMLDLARWVRFRWRIKPEIAVADTKYGTIANIRDLELDGIRAYLPIPDHNKRTDFYNQDDFHYDTEYDLFICPQGHQLPLWSRRKSEATYVYRADAKICNACPVKPNCTDSKSGRHLRRSFFQEQLDKAESYRNTEAYKKALRKRQVWVEPLFGEMKQWHQGRRFRLRRLRKVNIEGLIRVAGQNIKRLLAWFKTPES